MKNDEIGATLLAAGIAAVAGVATALFAKTLAGDLYFNVGANIIQWASGAATFGAVGYALWVRWNRTCAVPYCFRLGEHPVARTLRKVCTHHHTLSSHLRCHDLYGEKHRASGRLGLGESHQARFAAKGRKT